MEKMDGQINKFQRLKVKLSERKSYTIVVIDDDEYFNRLIVSKANVAAEKIKYLLKKDVAVLSYTNGDKFLKDLQNQQFQMMNLIVFLDFYLGQNLNGLFILNRLMFLENEPAVFIFSDRNDRQIAVEVKKAGAILFMHKDVYSPDICQVLLEELLMLNN
jgi:FixJ family two-component response regulator